MKLADKTFIITGACSGLGEATALHLTKQGANTILADLDVDQGQKMETSLQGQGLFIQIDVTQLDTIESGFVTAHKRYGAVHGLINCAGILVSERLIKKDGSLFNPDQFKQCIDVNLTGTFNTMRMITPYLLGNDPDNQGERGIIINTASIAAYEGQIGQFAYSASKAGVIGMTLPIARELSQHGIRVVTIAPGVFETPMFASISADKRHALEQQVPFPSRLGNPTEFAALVQHLIVNPMLNGCVIRLDGGLRLS